MSEEVRERRRKQAATEVSGWVGGLVREEVSEWVGEGVSSGSKREKETSCYQGEWVGEGVNE